MRVTIPATVEIIANLATGERSTESFTFAKDFICLGILLDPKWGASMASLYLAWDIRAIFAGKSPGESVELSHEQYKALLDAVENPSAARNMPLAIQIRSYYEAIICPGSGSA